MSSGETTAKERNRVPTSELRWSCPDDCLEFESTEGVAPIEGTIGQDRALKALRVGLELFEYSSISGNTFVCEFRDSLGGRGARQQGREVAGAQPPAGAAPKKPETVEEAMALSKGETPKAAAKPKATTAAKKAPAKKAKPAASAKATKTTKSSKPAARGKTAKARTSRGGK